MLTKPLTRGLETFIDSVDSDLFKDRNWLASLNTHSGKNYVYRRDLGARKEPRKMRYLHREIMSRILARDLTSTEQVDHMNGDSLDNRRSNLRLATASQNQSNIRKINSKTGYKGVVKYGDRFSVFCGISGGKRYLGSFSTAEAGANAYDIEAVKRAGTFAATNKDIL